MRRSSIAAMVFGGALLLGLLVADLLTLRGQSAGDFTVATLTAGAVLCGLALSVGIVAVVVPFGTDRGVVAAALVFSLAFVVSIAGLSLAAGDHGSSSGTAVAPDPKPDPKPVGERDEGPEADNPCGTERWAVKTLSDPAAKQVGIAAPTPTTVPKLGRRKAPAKVPREWPRQPLESTVFSIPVRLVAVRYVGGSKEDRDLHLIVSGPGGGPTMIVEFPDVACPGATTSPAHTQMFEARQAFERACGRPPQKFISLDGRASIEGVAFWDRSHGPNSPRGRAPNSLELHPVTRFKMKKGSKCERVL
jgi:hypothetical protein